jgi:hypothetical protein
MNVTIDQAIEIYAHGLRHRMGPKASLSARQEAERLKAVGDDHGFEVWTRVALHIEGADSDKERKEERH